jgi:nitroreductase
MIDIIKNRYSPRAFTTDEITDEKLLNIIEAAGTAPSSNNAQPWKYLIVRRNSEKRQAVLQSMSEFNRNWAIEIPIIIVNMALKNYEHNQKEYPHAWYDLGQSVAYFTLQAMAENIYVHQLGGFDRMMLENELNIDKKYTIVSLMVLGHKASPDKLPEDLRKKELSPRQRKELKDIYDFI